jgi:hypothetical protein
MTQDEIIEMARQAGIGWGEGIGGMTDFLEAFAKLVAEKAFQNGYEKGIAAFNDAVLLEREAIIQIIKATPFSNWFQADLIEAIRARGNT